MNFSTFDEIIASGKKYSILYADIPWEYDDKALAGNRGAGCKYPTMTHEENSNLPTYLIAAPDSILFFWGTWPHLKLAPWVMESWGFEYKTCAFLWVKRYANGNTFKGMGNWTRANTEFCLLGIRGNPKRASKGVSQVLETIEQGEWTPEAITTDIKKHSEKPDTFRQRILELCGNLPRIELFARTKIHGWDTFGNDHKLKLEPLEAFT